jgi:DNA repair protein RadC
MHYHGHRQRLREKLKKNPSDLPDYEILELLLGYVLTRRDTKPLAKALLDKFQTMRGMLDAKPAELDGLNDVGPGILNYWLLLREIIARYAESPLRQREILATPEEVAQMAMRRLAGNPREEIWLAFVDTHNHLIVWEQSQRGSIDGAMFYPRDILERALLLKASGFIIVHNHPGGTARPSGADLQMTEQMRRAAQSMSIRFLDHLIVTDSAYCSIIKDGFL